VGDRSSLDPAVVWRPRCELGQRDRWLALQVSGYPGGALPVAPIRLRLAVAALAAATAALALTLATPAAAAPIEQSQFLAFARAGIASARSHWWNPRLGWYDDRLDRSWRPTMPLAYLWSAFPLFEAIDAVAIAQPTAANRAAVRSFASNAERYWNPSLKPLGGYAYYIGTHTRTVHTYFDDNGWWGIAFADAFRATGDRRYLDDAARAFAFIVTSGWNRDGGGTWWDTSHDHLTSEPLAAAAYIGAVIYGSTRDPRYLAELKKLLGWANAHSWNASAQLYGRSPTDSTVMDYVEGMMIGADLELCTATGSATYCAAAEQLGLASLREFSGELAWSATADGMYLRFLLDLYRHDGNAQLYDLAYTNATTALSLARDPSTGLYLRSWNGTSPLLPGLLRTHAGTVALLAWLAATPAPKH
jgi:glycosyl hydrolase family 76